MVNKRPQVGMGATLFYPSDRLPFVVTAVSKSSKKVTLAELDTTGLKPSHYNGPYPIYDQTFDNPANSPKTKRVITCFANKVGQYFYANCPIVFGQARYYRDHSD